MCRLTVVLGDIVASHIEADEGLLQVVQAMGELCRSRTRIAASGLSRYMACVTSSRCSAVPVEHAAKLIASHDLCAIIHARVANQPIRAKRLTPRIGAEISGVDLSQPLTDEQFRAVHDALMEHQVIFFRDQNLTPAQQKAFGQRFGPLHVHPASSNHPEGHPEVMVIHADESSRWVAGELWHSDVSCDEAPPMGSVLYLQEVPPVGGDTLFASMYAAYETLSEPIRSMLDRLTAMHDGAHYYVGRYDTAEHRKDYPRAEHPVVCAHPVTGRRVLFVNRTFTTRIPALAPAESDAILEMLYRHIETPEFQCRFTWQPGSVAFWDNRCVQHRAIWDYYPHRRHGHRVTIQGRRPDR